MSELDDILKRQALPITPPLPPAADSKPPRKPRKPKAPKAPPKPRKKPDTVYSWLRDQGGTFAEAARILGKDFVKRLREELEYSEVRTRALFRVQNLTIALAEAQQAAKEFPTLPPRAEQARLERLAKKIAEERGDVPVPEAPVLENKVDPSLSLTAADLEVLPVTDPRHPDYVLPY